jgi:hypothetical protein
MAATEVLTTVPDTVVNRSDPAAVRQIASRTPAVSPAPTSTVRSTCTWSPS